MATPAAFRPVTLRTWTVDLAACAVAGALLGVLGPFGSYLNGGLLSRVGYWTGTFVLTGVVLSALLRTAAPLARRRRIPVWLWLPLLVLVVNGPVSVAARAAAIAIWPGLGEHV